MLSRSLRLKIIKLLFKYWISRPVGSRYYDEYFDLQGTKLQVPIPLLEFMTIIWSEITIFVFLPKDYVEFKKKND